MMDDRDGENEEVRSAAAEAGEASNGSSPPPPKVPDQEEEALENAWGAVGGEAASYRRAVVTPPRPVSGPPRPVSVPPLGVSGPSVVLKSKPISVPPPELSPQRPRMNTPPYGSQPPPGAELAGALNVPPLKVPSITAPSAPTIVAAPSAPTIVATESAPPEAKPVSDSVPPTSRRLAPPPKPRNKSNPTEGEAENGAAPVVVPSAPPVPDIKASSPPRAPQKSAPPPVDIDFDTSQADDKPAAKVAASDGPSPIFVAAATVVGAPIEATPPAEPVEPRRSEPPPPPTHIVVPNDEVPAPPSKPTPAPAIQVMRIIAVGTPTAATSAKPAVENLESDDITEEEPPAPKSDDAMELSDADVSPDSDRPKGAELAKRAPPPPPPAPSESGREDAISIIPEEVEAGEQKPAVSAKSEHKPPPPPPKRAPSSKRVSEVDLEPASEASPGVKKQRQRRPWWEELFSEDFVRANFKLSDAQVRREVNFIEESLGVAPGGVVLDLGCGAGHHAVELASRGYGVVGYDLSLYQLALAAEVAQERDQKINFLQGDMREMAFEEMFDGVFSWNTTFGYFEEEKNLNVAQRVFKALKPGGMFLVDVINRDFAATQSPSSLWYEGDACVCMDDMSVDFITSRLRVKRSIILDDGRTREVSYSIRLYSLHELGKLLHEVGFRVTEASGHPNIPGVFFGEQSPRIIMLAQKP
jgi:SAM-dependent methyltransferase